MYPSISGSFPLQLWFWDSTLLHVALVHHFQRCVTAFHSMNLQEIIYPFYCWWTFGLFQLGTIMKNVAMNMFLMSPGTHVHSQGVYLGADLLAHRVCITTFSTSLYTTKLYTNSTISVWDFLLLHILTNTWDHQ